MTCTPGDDRPHSEPAPHLSTKVVSRWSHTEAATVHAATAMRSTLRAWLRTRDVAELESDIVLAVYEAVANSVEHAYPSADEPGPVTISAHHRPNELTVTVTDNGRWDTPRPQPFRGHGLGLLRATADTVSIDHRIDTGTAVTLRWNPDDHRPT